MKKLSAVILGITFLGAINNFVAASQDFSKIKPKEYNLPIGTSVAKGGVNITGKNISFQNKDTKLNLAGTLYLPKNFDKNKKYPAIIVTGPMLSVKEHSQTIYAQRLAERGYVTLVFDYTYFGESEGKPRFFEDPNMKASDISSAVTYLTTLKNIDSKHIGAIGICGSGGYVPYAAAKDRRISSVVSIVPFTVQDEWLQVPLSEAIKDKENYEKGKQPKYISLMDSDSEGAAYYYNKERGFRENWSNLTVTWSEETWQKYHPTQEIKNLNVPYLVITSENAFTRGQAQKLYDNAKSKKEIYVIKKAGHFDMYDLEPYVSENLNVIDNFFKKNI